jgi:hypothetical protein
MVVNCDWNHIIIRMYKISYEITHIKTTASLDGISLLPIDIFALLRMVGLSQLPKRRLLFTMESSNIFHGKLNHFF